MEHDAVLINTKLYRTAGHSIQSVTIMILGVIMLILGMYDINLEYQAELALKQSEAEEAAANAENDEQEKPKEEAGAEDEKTKEEGE